MPALAKLAAPMKLTDRTELSAPRMFLSTESIYENSRAASPADRQLPYRQPIYRQVDLVAADGDEV